MDPDAAATRRAGRGRRILATLAAAAVTVVLGGAAPAGADFPAWKKLVLKASAGLLLSGRVEMDLRREGGTTRFETSTRARLLGITLAKTRTWSILDSATGLPRSYVSLSNKRGRQYVFDDTGYEVRFLEPTHGFDAPLDQWEVTGTRRHDLPRNPDGEGALPVYDYYGMMLGLSRMDLNAVGDEAIVNIATSDGPEPFTLHVAEMRSGPRTYTNLASDQSSTVDLTELMLKVIPLDPEDDHGFLGMKGETEIWVEKGSKTFVHIRGRIPSAGMVDIILKGLDPAG